MKREVKERLVKLDRNRCRKIECFTITSLPPVPVSSASSPQRLSPKALVGVCCECVEVMEGGVMREDGEFSDGMPEDIVSEMNKIHQRIIQETGMESDHWRLCVCRQM